MIEWQVHWDGGELLSPDGEVLMPVHGDEPDTTIAHRVVDEWGGRFPVLHAFPPIDKWPFWWTLREVLFRNLYLALPHARMLHRLRNGMATPPCRIVLNRPPTSWWLPLLQAAFPEAEIVVIPPCKNRTEKARWWMARARRALASSRRMRRLPPPDPKRLRVLILGRDRTWTGCHDKGFDTITSAMEAMGFEMVTLATSAGDSARLLFCLKTRPEGHLFVEQALFAYLRRHCVPKVACPGLSEERFDADGLDMTRLVHHVIRDQAPAHWRQQCVYAHAVTDIARRIGAKVALIADENSSAASIKMGLMRAGVRTVAVQHGLINEHHLIYAFPKDADPDSIPLCDVTCVYGEKVRDVLVNSSVYPESSVVVTGQPELDNQSSPSVVEPAGLMSAMRDRVLPPGRTRLLLFASQHPQRIVYGPRLLKALAASSSANHLVIRPHPLEPPSPFWDETAAKLGVADRVKVIGDTSLHDWLRACDVLLSCSSTVLNEAVLFGKPVITLGARENGDQTRCIESGVAVDLDDFPTLDAALDYWFEADEDMRNEMERRRRAFVEDEYYRLDGHAGERVAAVVKRMVDGEFG